MKFFAFFALLLVGCDDSTSSGTGPRGGEDDAFVAVDAAPPDAAPIIQTVTITQPLDGAVLGGRFVAVDGVVVGPVQTVTVNGAMASVNNGLFTIRIELESGSHEIVALAGEAEDRLRITMDAAPPRIDITSPQRAFFTADGQTDLEFTITDDAGLDQVLFDGDLSVEPGLGPDFLLPGLPLSPGWNILRLEATDTAGNRTREHVATLHGPLQDPALLVPAALRLHIGPAGIDGLEAIALAYLAGLDLTSFIPNPVFDQGIFRAEVTSITYRDPPILELTPTPGRLMARLRLEEVVMVLGLVISDNSVYEIGAGAGAIEVTGALIPRVEEGRIVIRLEDVQTVFTDLRVQPGGVPQFENNPEEGQAIIEQIASQAVALLADSFLPDLLARVLTLLDEPFDLTLLGAELSLSLVPDVIVVSDRGLSARVSVGVTLNNPPPTEPALAGYVGTRTPWDGVPDTDGIGIAIDDDLINLLLYQVWRKGGLFPRLDRQSEAGRDAGLVTSLLGTLVRRAIPGLEAETPIAIGTSLPLPPSVRVRKEDGAVGLVLAFGDMVVDINADDASNLDILEGAASLEIIAAVGVVAGAQPGTLALDLEVTDTIAAFDVTTPALRGEAENSLEGPVNDLLSRLGALLPGLLRDLPIPTLGFLTFTDLRADSVGPDGTFIGLFGNVAAPVTP